MKIFTLFLITLFVYSCDNSKPVFEDAGGALHICLNDEPESYFSRDVNDAHSFTVLSQVMECLISFDQKDLSITPQIAKSWKISPDKLKYEFTIRENILFHPHDVFTSDQDRILTVDDVRKTIETICSPGTNEAPGVAYAFVFEQYLVGAKDFYSKKSKSIKGLTVKGNKITFELSERDNNFLNKLANVSCAIFSSKIYEANVEQDMIGTGPFLFREFKKDEINSLILLKNEEYYLTDENGFALPYLDSVVFHLESRKLEQLEMFEQGKVDIIEGLPSSRITKMLEGRISDFNSNPPLFVLQNNPSLMTNYYCFNMLDARFKNIKVRQAFNYAIDKEKFGNEILRNQYSELGYYGIVPPITSTFRGYDFESVKAKSYSYDPEKARKLLSEAGYPGGKGFGYVTLRFNINDIHSAIADEFSKQIYSVLGININIDGSTFNQLKEDAEAGKGEIFRTGWVADYPSPETFLFNFYGKTNTKNKKGIDIINLSKYKNTEFDKYFDLAKKSNKLSEQMYYFSKSENILMSDPPLIPLWYRGDYQIVYSKLRNLHFNSLNLLHFRNVYKKEWTKAEYLASMKKLNK